VVSAKGVRSAKPEAGLSEDPHPSGRIGDVGNLGIHRF
jgi:hypothetical protein